MCARPGRRIPPDADSDRVRSAGCDHTISTSGARPGCRLCCAFSPYARLSECGRKQGDRQTITTTGETRTAPTAHRIPPLNAQKALACAVEAVTDNLNSETPALIRADTAKPALGSFERRRRADSGVVDRAPHERAGEGAQRATPKPTTTRSTAERPWQSWLQSITPQRRRHEWVGSGLRSSPLQDPGHFQR